jgi:hypothetical protein
VEATAKNADKTARTAYEMAEAQRDSFEAVAENFAAAQRRSMGLAEGGLEFVKLQEDNARAAQEFFANGVRLLKLQQNNAEFVQGWMGDAVDLTRASVLPVGKNKCVGSSRPRPRPYEEREQRRTCAS